MSEDYSAIKITVQDATNIVRDLFGIEGFLNPLPGELDFNFRVKTTSDNYLLKISRPNADLEFINFQEAILQHIKKSGQIAHSPHILPNKNDDLLSIHTDSLGNERLVRLLSWLEGRLWSDVNPQSSHLLESLGEEAGSLTTALKDFDHSYAHREFDWDVAQGSWVEDHLKLFSDEQLAVARYFLDLFNSAEEPYKKLKKSVIHGDVNDNNVVVSKDLYKPVIKGVIDYGDAIFTQTINDLAITIAYATMNKPAPLEASVAIINGYHKQHPLEEKELSHLYTLVAIRLLISVTKSAINRQIEPDNEYLLVSEQPAWKLLFKWRQIDKNLALAFFRDACGYTAHPNEITFKNWAAHNKFELADMFPETSFSHVVSPDLSIGSTWAGHEIEQKNLDIFTQKIKALQKKIPDSLLAGGYKEIRSIYSTTAYKVESNQGPQYRTVHLGLDFWLPPNTPVHSVLDGKIYAVANNDNDKDYGPTIILEHEFDSIKFYSLFGHLSSTSLEGVKPNVPVKKGDRIGSIGNFHENGGWSPHLHFQLILDMLDNKSDFPGVATYQEVACWTSLSPDPNWLFKQKGLDQHREQQDLVKYRQEHLGKGLSVSYKEPLTIVRGSGVYLIDNIGRRYLDTINNVAHVGHEHPDVVKVGQQQMAVLNTNTRYLHKNINEFAERLLKTFPKELSVVHFVNSGSEANELALRMAKTVTGQRDMIAVEIGYHGNTNACIDISSYKFDGIGGSGTPEHTHIVPLPDAFRGRYRGGNTGEKYAAHIQEQILNITKKGRGLAGFICESIISCGGQIELPEDYLKLAYTTVRKAGGVCIADEVQVGCGRVGKSFWGFQLHDVVPDIVTIGKPIGNGHPLAAVVCTKKVAEAFANGMEYFNTFGGNPVSCAIGNEVLNVICRENLQDNAEKTGNYLKSMLFDLQKELPVIGDVRGQGFFLGLELTDSDKKPLPKKASYLTNRMKDFGILMSVDGPDLNVLKIKPPMVFSKENADELIARLRQVFNEGPMSL